MTIMMNKSSPTSELGPLEVVINDRIAMAGGIPFVDFMGLCLYHPLYGYYMVDRKRLGREGDFFTSSSVHVIFGRLIAKQLRQMWEILGCPGDFVVAEQGAGEGHLCLDILNAVQQDSPPFYASLQYHLLEISPDNRKRQAKLLQSHESKVAWSELGSLVGMEGCFLSNELVDAFPVHLVEMRDGELREVFVCIQDGMLREELRVPSTDALQQYFSWLGITLTEGQRAEVNLAAPEWIKQVATVLRRGFVLTIDYGYPAAELYAPWRTGGTLMCYHRHTASENPYERIGEQDITAHVDFTALQKSGKEMGLVPLFLGEQYRFLLGLGFVEELVEAQMRETEPTRAQALRLTLKNLILPEGGMGETFKVLVQGKGVGEPLLLCARAIRDLPMPGIPGNV